MAETKTKSGTIVHPHYGCTVGAAYTVAAIKGGVPIANCGPGCMYKQFFLISFDNGFQGSAGAGGGNIPSANVGENDIVFGGTKKLDDLIRSSLEELREGKSYDIRDEKYQREAHGEMDRCRHICWQINSTDPADRERIMELENELLNGQMKDGNFFTPPFQIDCANRVFLGKNVFANHGLTVMSIGTITIEDGVMMGPEVGLFTVNHEPNNIRVIKTKEIHIKKNAWIGARVNILAGVTIGENAIVGTGSVVTKDIPDNCVAVGNPARVIKRIDGGEVE